MDWSVGYREMPPPRGMQRALECLWVRVTPPVAGPAVLVLPDAGADVMWQRGADPFVAGPDTGPMPVELPPDTVLIGARFRPGAAGPALRWSMNELRDQRVALSDLRTDLAPKLSGDMDPGDAAVQQAHLTRECNQLAGMTPTALIGTMSDSFKTSGDEP